MRHPGCLLVYNNGISSILQNINCTYNKRTSICTIYPSRKIPMFVPHIIYRVEGVRGGDVAPMSDEPILDPHTHHCLNLSRYERRAQSFVLIKMASVGFLGDYIV